MKNRLVLFARAFSPFAMFTALMGVVSPPAVAAVLALSAGRAAFVSADASGAKPKFRLRAANAAYWLFIAVMSAFFVRVLFNSDWIFLAATTIACAGAAAAKKIRPTAAVAIALNIFSILFFIHFLPPRLDNRAFARLNAEPCARALCSLKPFIKDGHYELEGVRSIITSADEKYVFFTVDHGPAKRGKSAPPSLFKAPMNYSEDARTLNGDRLFGLATTPGGGRLLATSYYDSKLLVIDPETLKIHGSRKTSAYPQHIIMDERGGRATVLHEGLGLANIYSLPDLKLYRKSKISGAPSKIVVDPRRRVFFASNWMYPYLLTETEMFSLRTRRKKFFLSFDGGGVALDRSRDRIYITRGITGAVLGVDRKTFKTVDKIQTPSFARPVYVDEKRRLIYVGNTADPYVRVYDYSRKMIGKIYVGPNCREITAAPVSNRIMAGSAMGLVELKIDLLLNNIRMREKQ